MLDKFKDCIQYCGNDSKKVLKDNKGGKSQYVIVNDMNKTFTIIKYDGCVVKNQTACDYIIYQEDNCFFCFIELKGSDLTKAIKQIKASVTRESTVIQNSKVSARIILSKVHAPDLRTTEIIKLKLDIQKMGGSLAYHTKSYEEKLSQLA